MVSENIDNLSSSNANGNAIKNSFVSKARQFIIDTEEHSLRGVNPGGVYQAIWCRDAAYILKSWFQSGNIDGVLQQLYHIWSHQIIADREKIIYGRGSPERNYHTVIAGTKKQQIFEGSLPTTIYTAGYCEVYGLNPDIDSTVLMIDTTSWILAKLLENKSSYHTDDNADVKDSLNSISISKLMANYSRVIDFVLPRMFIAVDHILTRDIDNDGLLEQNHNEDWMDTALRAGKIVYSQASWILALKNFSLLLSFLGKEDEAKRMKKIFTRTINAVEEQLWSEKDGCYIDVQETHHIEKRYKIVTQDVLLYLIAITENTSSDSLGIHTGGLQNSGKLNNIKKEKDNHDCCIIGNDGNNKLQDSLIIAKEEQKKELGLKFDRANKTLDVVRDRVWMNGWPVNIERLLKYSGPWFLKPYFYHNRTFWPWITGMEMLARSRFNRIEECNSLLSKLASKDTVNILTFYEWVDPNTGKGGGAFPFRTGICAVRTAIDHVINSLQ